MLEQVTARAQTARAHDDCCRRPPPLACARDAVSAKAPFAYQEVAIASPDVAIDSPDGASDSPDRASARFQIPFGSQTLRSSRRTSPPTSSEVPFG